MLLQTKDIINFLKLIDDQFDGNNDHKEDYIYEQLNKIESICMETLKKLKEGHFDKWED